MTDETKDRYDINNIPISEKTYKGLSTENINMLGAIGRMLSLQDEFIGDILGEIKEAIVKITQRLDIIETRLTRAEGDAKEALGKIIEEDSRILEHDNRLNKKKQEIEELRGEFEKYKEHLEYVSKIKPTLETLQNAFRFWRWKNWWKIVSIIVGIILVFSLMVIGIYSFMRQSGCLSQSKTSGIEKVWTDIKTGNISNDVRTIHFNNLTPTQKDSLINENEKEILSTIK
jgi:uncharacterized protein YjbJ (UPF0337 family)